MTSLMIKPPYSVFPDVDGEPLEDGYIYVGLPGLNPQSSPISLYFDDALTVPAPQPLRTLGGFISNSGSPANVFCDYATISITVRNKNGTLVYSNLNINTVDVFGDGLSVDSVDDLINSHGLLGQVKVKSFYGGWDDTLLGPTGGFLVHTTGGTAAVPSVGSPVSPSTIGIGVQAGLFYDADGKEWRLTPDQEINAYCFGCLCDGVTDDHDALQNYFDAFDEIVLPPQRIYFSGSITKAAHDVKVRAWGATIICDGSPSGFIFGESAAADSEPNYFGFSWEGGHFQNADGTENINRGYIELLGIADFYIGHVRLDEVSNGGILCRSGCQDGLIEDIYIPSKSSYSTVRGIWLNGADAADYQDQLVDTDSITRNANPVPVGGLRNITIRKCKIEIEAYGIYLMNSQHTTIDDNHIDIGGGTLRAITINTYSPYTRIINNHIAMSAVTASKGILVTQYSHDVVIDNNTFTGTNGSNVTIQTIFLANVSITNNRFLVDNAVCVTAEMGANGVVENNLFAASEGSTKTPGNRCLRIYTIGSVEVGLGYGDTATVLNGWRFTNNTIKVRNFGVQLTQQTSTGTSNEVGIDSVVVKNNEFHNWDTINNSQEYPLYIGSIASPTNPMYYICANNVTLPANSGFEVRNRAEDPVGSAIDMKSTSQDEELGAGTWDLEFADGAGNPAQTNAVVATWYRLNDLCFVQGYIDVSGLAGVTGTNAIQVLNLPFVADDTANTYWGGPVSIAVNCAVTAGTAMTFYVAPNSNTGRINTFDLATGTSQMTLNELTASGTMAFSGVYKIKDLTPT